MIDLKAELEDANALPEKSSRPSSNLNLQESPKEALESKRGSWPKTVR